MPENIQHSTITLAFDINRTWKALSDSSVKATIFYHILEIGGFKDYEQLQAQYPVTVVINRNKNQVEIQFSNLQALGIVDKPNSCPADLAKSLQDKAILLADLETQANLLLAHSKILGTRVRGFDTTPHHCQS